MKRIYIALVLGHVTGDGWVDAPIGRHPVHRTKMAVTTGGKEARTYYQVIEKLEGCTMLQCTLETGRTHQIRVHMQSPWASPGGRPGLWRQAQAADPPSGQLIAGLSTPGFAREAAGTRPTRNTGKKVAREVEPSRGYGEPVADAAPITMTVTTPPIQASGDWIVPDWPAPPNVKALFTTRNGGSGSGPYASLNLAAHVGDDPLTVTGTGYYFAIFCQASRNG